jgi:flagellar basal body-associated protein FliL
MEQKPQPQEQEAQAQKKEPVISKTTLVIIAVFLLMNIGIIAVAFGPRIFGEKKQEEEAVSTSPLDKITPVELGQLIIVKPIDPVQQSYMRCQVTVTLTILAEKAPEVEEKIRKFEAVFKEIARKAFLDADARDVASENLAGVKTTIKTRINALLGEDAVQEVVFGDFRPY